MVVVALCRWLLQSSGGGGGDRKAKGCALAICAPGTSDCLCVWPPATNKKQFHCVWAPATRAHTHTQCHRVHGGQSCTFLNRLWVHIPKNKTQHTRPFVPNSCSPLVKRVLRFAGSFARVCLLWMSSRRGAAGCAWVAMCSSLLRRPPFENAGGSVGDGKSPHLASFHPPT